MTKITQKTKTEAAVEAALAVLIGDNENVEIQGVLVKDRDEKGKMIKTTFTVILGGSAFNHPTKRWHHRNNRAPKIEALGLSLTTPKKERGGAVMYELRAAA